MSKAWTAGDDAPQAQAEAQRSSGIAPRSLAKLLQVFEAWPGVERVVVFGSRARGDFRTDSDIDLAVDAPTFAARDVSRLLTAVERLELLYKIDLVHLQSGLNEKFVQNIERDGRVIWAPHRQRSDVEELAGVSLKDYQARVLGRLNDYLVELALQQRHTAQAVEALRVMEGMEEALRVAGDYPKKAWDALRQRQQLPPAFASQAHSSRFDGADRAIPNVCLKVPTGGGKTLLAAASVASVFTRLFHRHTGLVLWVVPNEAIYQQTLKTLTDLDHPYRQMLNLAGAGRVKILEKNSPLSRLDTDGHLCVMVLMLASAARQSKETLRFFRDRGNVLGFLPPEDDYDAHFKLLQTVPNLDAYASLGESAQSTRRQMGSIVKSSLGNVMRLLRPMVVMDEGHHAYTETAMKTLDGFNPGFLLELSATPRVASAKPGGGSGSNILVDVRGTDLESAQMIKLPIHVNVQHWSDWQACLAASVERLNGLQAEAHELQAQTARYIRPMLLVQVERTGADTRDAGFIHAEDVRAYLLQLGFDAREIAVKTAEVNDLRSPENIDLLSPVCEVRVIITKQALQEGWDCPFAYVLCALAAGRNPAAMTQLVGRILRQPHVTKTGRDALDACYVLCHDAQTGKVVGAIKKSLEGEGMGDLTLAVSGDRAGDTTPTGQVVTLRRRAAFEGWRLFLPRVSLVLDDNTRRELVYESDVLARLPWEQLDASALARDWAPNLEAPLGEQFDVSLSILQRGGRATSNLAATPAGAAVDRAQLVRALLDIVPHAWWLWGWIDAVVDRLAAAGYDDGAIAVSSSSLIERLRVDLERERDRLAEEVFMQGVAAGRIEFALRADQCQYELPQEMDVVASGSPKPLTRADARPVEKSLLEPALHSGDMNDFEAAFAGYLDGKQAVRWWHRNVAKVQYGLQGWRRNKVYPDFVFGWRSDAGEQRVVLLETKGAHLAGSTDTDYKRDLLRRLDSAYADRRWQQVGELALTDRSEAVTVSCDLLIDTAWEGALESRWFSPPR